MADPWVREIGRVELDDGPPVVVGLDYHEISLCAPNVTLSSYKAEELAQLLSRAQWELGNQSALLAEAAT